MLGTAIVRTERTYAVRTLGCQMNAHDSERIAGLLEAAGFTPARGGRAIGPTSELTSLPEADVVVINTCAVRENAATRLYGNLGQLAQIKANHPGMQIAVGGCLAQKDREVILQRAPWVDVVFGTHTIASLPALLARAAHNHEAQIEIAEALTVFPSTLPSRRESVYAAWVSISVGCNNTCTFCIVPSLRGRERDRRPGEIIAEIEALVADGAIEVTLLGQNVNTYGAEFGERGAFASLLRAAGAVPGLERLRFTSPHPAAFTDDVIAAMAEVPTVMPGLHMPLQSGSDRVLRAMRRSYRRERFLGILRRVREAIPEAAISTDVIVGFPGETEEDFEATLDTVREARFISAFTFQYSPRPGTPAADMPDQVPPEVMGERYRRLVALQESISQDENRAQVGRTVEVIVSGAPGRKDTATSRVSGRAADGRLVHIGLPTDDDGRQVSGGMPRPGDIVRVRVTASAPHHLIADSPAHGELFEIRRTPSGDAWAKRQADAPDAGTGIPLGMPALRVSGP